MPSLRSAAAEDANSIRVLLERNGLPTRDLASSRPEFVVVYDGAELIGAGALQPFGSTALLRSVVVAAGRRGGGLGERIVRELERRACTAGISELVLLTQTAAPFFERQGYRIIDRSAVGQAMQASAEFGSLCPASATCMSKRLTGPESS